MRWLVIVPAIWAGIVAASAQEARPDKVDSQALRAAGHTQLVVGGVITNNSVEATVRMAGNLGFDVRLVADACATVGRRDYNGKEWSAEDVHALALANMQGEYARVVDTKSVLRALKAP